MVELVSEVVVSEEVGVEVEVAEDVGEVDVREVELDPDAVWDEEVVGWTFPLEVLEGVFEVPPPRQPLATTPRITMATKRRAYLLMLSPKTL
ncbi:hypothetical protein [Thermococcus sp.]|uniref:hypothetical protein n=1 Tax=Thermococcus sp. TaxID=35749 RepID=UPI0026024E4C|nr:hypothetical protein [Thermococcus sp.]